MKEILLVRLAALLAAAAVVAACALLEEQAPALDSAATRAAQTGGCIRFVERDASSDIACAVAIWSDTPLQNCRPAIGRCERN